MQFKVVHIEETDSTNRWLKELVSDLSEGVPVVVADYQTAGKGCGTNTWESERGKNLTFSLLLRPKDMPASEQFILSMANALALRDTLAAYTDDVKIKWPNDIYWRDKKICGTLIETTLQGRLVRDCIIGTGINVNQRVFLSDAPNPVSLAQILGRDVNCSEVLQLFLNKTEKYMELVEGGSWDVVRASYRHHLFRKGEHCRFRFPDGAVKTCKLADVSNDGHLELFGESGEIYSMAFKEVQFII